MCEPGSSRRSGLTCSTSSLLMNLIQFDLRVRVSPKKKHRMGAKANEKGEGEGFPKLRRRHDGAPAHIPPPLRDNKYIVNEKPLSFR
jgi:hypothetical protein